MNALELPVVYESAYINCWLTDYVRHGYRATSLPDRFASLRKEAKRRERDFPEKGSRSNDSISSFIRFCICCVVLPAIFIVGASG